jgi:hypothetical protein
LGRLLRNRVLKWSAAILLAMFVAIQLVPYGHAHSNPPVSSEPQWNSPRTRQLAVAACYDCHSNQTDWKWYTNIAPISWLTQNDVNAGRQALNFSEWDRHQRTREVAEVVREGSMPPWYYTPMHPASRLSAQEQQELVDGFIATFGQGSGGN